VRSATETSRKYALNEWFFYTIDREMRAYWLGLLAGDGRVLANGIEVRLSSHDRDHLISITSHLGI
jgi:hypothetical protein